MVKNNLLWNKQKELSQQLASLTTDKEKVKLLLRTIEINNTEHNLESMCIISFATGYLGSLLVMHNLNEWGD